MKTHKPWQPIWEAPLYAGQNEGEHISHMIAPWDKQAWAFSCTKGYPIILVRKINRITSVKSGGIAYRCGTPDNCEKDPLLTWEQAKKGVADARAKGVSLKEAFHQFMDQDDPLVYPRFCSAPEIPVRQIAAGQSRAKEEAERKKVADEFAAKMKAAAAPKK